MRITAAPGSNLVLYIIAFIIISILAYSLYSHYSSDKVKGDGVKGDGVKDENTCDGTLFNSNSIEDFKNKNKPVNSPECYKKSNCNIIMNKIPGSLKSSYESVLDTVVTKYDTDEINIFKYNCSKCLQGSDNNPVIKKLSNLCKTDSEFAMKMCDAMSVKCGNPSLYAISNINWDNECRDDLSDGVDKFFCALLKNGVIQFILGIIPDSCSLQIMGDKFIAAI